MKHTKKSVFAALIGNTLEWYDFAVFGLLAVVIGKQFFPSSDETASTIAALGVFAGAYLARPFGGAVFGFIGDRFGRKSALRLSILSMGIPTVLIGCLPTYGEIGILAPILLLFLRLTQGVSIGGEFIGSMVYLSEIAPSGRKYFYSSFAILGILFGILLGSAVCGLLFFAVGETGVLEYGWRIPFLLGVFIIAFGIWMRRNMHEPSICLDKAHNPTVEAIKNHKKALLFVVLLTAYIGVAFHTLFIWYPTYLATIVEPHVKDGLSYNFISLSFYGVAVIAGAKMADKYGAKIIFISSLAFFALALYPMFMFINSGELWKAVVAQSVLAVLLALSHAISPLTISGLFPSSVRSSGLGLAFNAMVAVFAGTAPIACTYMIKLSGDKLAPSYYIAAMSVIAIVAYAWLPKEERSFL